MLKSLWTIMLKFAWWLIKNKIGLHLNRPSEEKLGQTVGFESF